MSFTTFALIASSLSSAPNATLPVFSIFEITTDEIEHYPQGKQNCLKWDEDRLFCPTGWQLGSVRMQSLNFTYVNGKLAEVRGLAKFGEFALLVKTLSLKYGEPKNAGRQLTWYFQGGKMVAHKINPQVHNNMADSEFLFISEDNSNLPERLPVVDF